MPAGRRRAWPWLPPLLRTHPRLAAAVAAGAATWALLPPGVAGHEATRVLLGWNVGMLVYLLLAWQTLHGADVHRIRERALRQDDGRLFVLGASILAALAVLVAVGSQLSIAKDMHGLPRAWRVALSAATVVTSWLFVQTTFALHYAHEFYLARTGSPGGTDALSFPGTTDPLYRDFMYFACIIGTSGQTADVAFVGGTLRAVGTVHCIFAFFFNVALLGLTINIAASLVSGG